MDEVHGRSSADEVSSAPVTAQPLDYCRPLPRKGRPFPWYFSPPKEPEDRRWWCRHLLYCLGLGALFSAIAFYFGPNVILFRKLTRLEPADFIDEARQSGVPLVRAVKEFGRDHGHLPNDVEELTPDYLDCDIDLLRRHPSFDSYSVRFYSFERSGGHELEYDLRPASEGWEVYGPFARGPIPLPIVTIDAASRGASRSSGN